MQRQRIGEDEAWRRLRKAARGRGLRIAEFSRRLLDAVDVLGNSA